jgi:hypothetical protein
LSVQARAECAGRAAIVNMVCVANHFGPYHLSRVARVPTRRPAVQIGRRRPV